MSGRALTLVADHQAQATSLEVLLDAISLDQIVATDLSASTHADPPEEQEDGMVSFSFNVAQTDDRSGLKLTVGAVARQGSLMLACTYDLVYSLEPAMELSDPDVRTAFVDRLGLFHATPYLRESLHDLARRLEVSPPMIPLLKATDLKSREWSPADPD